MRTTSRRKAPIPGLFLLLLWFSLCAAACSAWAELTVTISGTSPRTVLEDERLELPFSVTATGVVPDSLYVTARMVSTNIAYVELADFDGTNGLARITPFPDAAGLTSLQISAWGIDATTRAPVSTNAGFSVRWVPANDPPRFVPVAPLTVRAGGPALAVPLTVTDPEKNAFTLQVTVEHPELFNALGVSTPSGGYLKIAAPEEAHGNTVVSIRAQDSLGATSQLDIAIRILPSSWRHISTRVDTNINLAGQVVDVNADGLMDLVCVPEVGLTQFRLNAGGANLTNITAKPLFGLINPTQWLDVNGDGLPDPVRADSVLLQSLPDPVSGELLFTYGATNVLGRLVSGRTFALLDVDGDGDVEPGFSNRYQNGALTVATNNLPVSGNRAIAGDFDGDGLADVLLNNTGAAQGFYGLWLNEGGYRFTPGLGGLWLKNPVAHGTVDIDGDGRLDVWVVEAAGTETSSQLQLWHNGLTGFELIAQFDTGVIGVPVPVWGDLDNDGDLDFIFPRLSTELYFIGESTVGRRPFWFTYYNDGEGNFRPQEPLAMYDSGTQAASGDFDGDGSLDVWLPSPADQILFSPHPANALPSTPTGLHAVQTGEGILFVWDRAFDPNQTAVLSYNLRVGTQPGTNDVIASLSVADGRRQVTGPGNNGFNTHRLLYLSRREFANPAPDRLYWSVQAVDNSWAASPWAPEQSVEVELPRNRPPSVRNLPETLVIRESGATLSFEVFDDSTPVGLLTYRLLADDPNLVTTQETPKKLPVRSSSLPALAYVGVGLTSNDPTPAETTLTLIVADYAGLSTTNRIRLVTDPTRRGRLLTRPMPDGIRLSMFGYPGNTVRMETSSNLRDWVPLPEIVINTTDEQELFTVSPPTDGEGSRFYRVIP